MGVLCNDVTKEWYCSIGLTEQSGNSTTVTLVLAYTRHNPH